MSITINGLTISDIKGIVDTVFKNSSEYLVTLQSTSDTSSQIIDYSSKEYIERSQEINKQKKIIDVSRLVLDSILQIEEALKIESEDMKDLVEEEIKSSSEIIQKILPEIQLLTAKKLDDDDENAIIEIRPGVGGAEASLFANELFQMYTKYLTSKDIAIEIINIDYSDLGGIAEASFIVKKKGAYGLFRFEAGVHRVQRVPTTESAGRIHTSTASVVVMPQIENPDIKIDPNEIRIDVFRAGGPGGQSVNTTDSAVRVTHIPTGIMVTSQNTKSQHQNKETALKVLQNKLLQIEKERIASKLGQIRNEHMAGGDRSSKIRTYNFQQSRITDHRISKSWFNIAEIMSGFIDEVLTESGIEIRKEIEDQ